MRQKVVLSLDHYPVVEKQSQLIPFDFYRLHLSNTSISNVSMKIDHDFHNQINQN